MAAMSICSSLDPLQNLASMETFPESHTEFVPGLEQSLLGLPSTDTCIDPLLELEDYLVWNGLVPSYLSSIPSADNYALQNQDLEHYNPPKRQKIAEQLYSYSNLSADNNYLALADSYSVSGLDAFPEYHQSSLGLSIPAPRLTYASGTAEKHNEQKCVSPQSIAARQRRRKIAEKTEELGKLVPGGCKMSTAEMLQAAYKYVKFLQAQVGVLQLLHSNSSPEKSEGKAENMMEEIQSLLACSRVQGKLFAEEKCLVKKELVETLLNDQELQSKCNIDKDMEELIQKNGWCP